MDKERKKMKKKIRLYFLLVVISLVLGCGLNTFFINKSFYQKGSGWDYLRFPLLEPYYAIKISDEYGWAIPLYTEKSKRNFWYYLEIQDVRKIAVENGAVMVYSAYSKPILVDISENRVLTEKELHWFILIPGQTETGFETEEEFNISLRQYSVDRPRWQEPLSILQTFDQTGCLQWIPDCRPTFVLTAFLSFVILAILLIIYWIYRKWLIKS
jgi:hypothetical protein